MSKVYRSNPSGLVMAVHDKFTDFMKQETQNMPDLIKMNIKRLVEKQTLLGKMENGHSSKSLPFALSMAAIFSFIGIASTFVVFVLKHYCACDNLNLTYFVVGTLVFIVSFQLYESIDLIMKYLKSRRATEKMAGHYNSATFPLTNK